jgi:hypothetical protein
MRKRDIFNSSKSISLIPNHLVGNSEHHSRSPPCMQNRLHEKNAATSIWRAKMSRRALIALKNFTMKKKCFSVRGPYIRLTEERELGDSTAAVCRSNRSVSDQEKALALVTAMKIVMRKWIAGIVNRYEAYWLTCIHRLHCVRYFTPRITATCSNGSMHNESQVPQCACHRSGGLSLVILRTLPADHQSHHRDADEAQKVICFPSVVYFIKYFIICALI